MYTKIVEMLKIYYLLYKKLYIQKTPQTELRNLIKLLYLKVAKDTLRWNKYRCFISNLFSNKTGIELVTELEFTLLMPAYGNPYLRG